MDFQRRDFYTRRQKVLEGRGLEGLLLEMIRQVVDEAVEDYLDGRYTRRCIAEWARQNLQIQIDDDQIHAESAEDFDDLQRNLRNRAKDEASSAISLTLGEYMDQELEPSQWDIRGLSSWAMSRFRVELSQNQLRKMNPHEVEARLSEAAAERIDQIDLTAALSYLESGYATEALAEWARSRFAIDVTGDELTDQADTARQVLTEKVEHAYSRREVEYPVEYAMDITIGQSGPDNVYALENLVSWANRKYEASLTVDDLRGAKAEDIRARLLELSEAWMSDGKLVEAVRAKLGSDPKVHDAIEFARQRFDTALAPEDFDGDVVGRVVEAGRKFLRREMTELERFVLLQIYDSSWKDHLLAMDHLKSGIGLRGYAEQDPRVAYKREGALQYEEMLIGVRDKVTDMIFKVRLGADAQLANVYQISGMVHEQLSGYDHLARQMAEQEAASQPQKIKQIVRDVPKVGRNDPCPCGSGKKFKKCCGRNL